MDRNFINKLMLIRDNEFDDQIQFILSRTIEKYPYFSLLYSYNAKCAKALNHNLDQSLSLASAYSPDRKHLKEIMETEGAIQFNSNTNSSMKNIDIINAKIEELKKLYSSDSKTGIRGIAKHDIIKEIDSYTEPDISDNPTKEELVERFLQIENPKVNNLDAEKESVSVNEVVKKSVEDEFVIVTETMANIYLKQGRSDKAIKIYRQLILANPEKSIYFATQIKKIEDNK
jgi:tetratricopeptide (TPR) repeat protein